MNKYIAQIGAAESEISLIETVPTREILIDGKDVYDAHKRAFMDLDLGQEILKITDQTGKILYTLKEGFKRV